MTQLLRLLLLLFPLDVQETKRKKELGKFQQGNRKESHFNFHEDFGEIFIYPGDLGGPLL